MREFPITISDYFWYFYIYKITIFYPMTGMAAIMFQDMASDWLQVLEFFD